MSRIDAISPVRVFLIVLGAVFVVEATIMIAVAALDALPRYGPLLSVVDALVLVMVICPVLWLLVVRPLRAAVEMRGTLLSRLLAAQEEERARLGRDLHDELGQLQTAVLLGARSIASATTVEESRRRAEEVARMASAALEASRRLARGVMPGSLVDLGLGVAADRLCEDLASSAGVPIDRAISTGNRRFAPTIEITAYRVLQEALTNAVRHAAPSRIRVALDADERTLTLEVRDDGSGMPADAGRGAIAGPGPDGSPEPAAGMGLAGMRERVTLLRGTFEISSSPGRGTAIRAAIPIDRQGVSS